MSYQAVIRNSSNVLVANATVGIQVSILQGSASGAAVYVETQAPTTNANGLVSMQIGAGTVVSGSFTAINWAAGPYFIKIETDIAGGTNYTITSTSQMLSVPYALYADKAGAIALSPHTVGESYGGGIVIYVTPDGTHGLIAATKDQADSATWFVAQDSISNPTKFDAETIKYTDWRLPTEYELYNLLYMQRALIGGFTNGYYWSSTEDDWHNAINYHFEDGSWHTGNKYGRYYVRAVRSF
jgi:hypothetical protein